VWPRAYLARLDGSTGMADSFNPNATRYAESISLQADGKIVPVGSFHGANSMGGQTQLSFSSLVSSLPYTTLRKVRINPAPPGSSAFHIAGASANVALVKMLGDRGGNPNQLRKDGYTPFLVAVAAGNLDVVKEMVAHGADLTMRYNPAHKIPDPEKAISLTRQNQTAMHIAALGGWLPIMEYLQSKGVALDLKNSTGETPLDLADAQERYRTAINRESADGDAEKLRAIVQNTETTDGIRKLLARR